jgi:hypothetical protein
MAIDSKEIILGLLLALASHFVQLELGGWCSDV